jgi:hypothetical protein
MWARILIAGIVGGVAVFLMGFVCHEKLKLQTRTLANMPESSTFIDQLKARGQKHGIYVFPDMSTKEEQKDAEKMKALNEQYKAGPSGLLIIAHPGQGIMEMLGKEFATNVIAALLAAWIVSLFGSDVGFGRRCAAVMLMGVFAWASLAASYGIWYGFSHEFVHDELFCALLEWSVAGVAIAAIVRRPPAAAPANNP